MRLGTCHFINRKSAERYYSFVDDPKGYVEDGIRRSSICIGQPKYDPLRQKLEIDGDGRYHIIDVRYK